MWVYIEEHTRPSKAVINIFSLFSVLTSQCPPSPLVQMYVSCVASQYRTLVMERFTNY